MKSTDGERRGPKIIRFFVEPAQKQSKEHHNFLCKVEVVGHQHGSLNDLSIA